MEGGVCHKIFSFLSNGVSMCFPSVQILPLPLVPLVPLVPVFSCIVFFFPFPPPYIHSLINIKIEEPEEPEE